MPYLILTQDELVSYVPEAALPPTDFEHGKLSAALNYMQTQGYKLNDVGFVSYPAYHSATPMTFVFEYEDNDQDQDDSTETRKGRIIV